jgi:hypothetical protein
MALHEHWADLDRVPRIKDSPLSHQLKNQPAEKLEAIRTANAALGHRMLNLAAERLANLGRQLLAQGTSP